MKKFLVLMMFFAAGMVVAKAVQHTQEQERAFNQGCAAGYWEAKAQVAETLHMPTPTPYPEWHDEWGAYFDNYVSVH